MPVKKYNPVTPGTRWRIGLDYSGLSKVEPEKSLISSQKETGGRNHTGKRTIRYHGGGHKKRYRIIDFKRTKHNVPATVMTIEYDPNRSAFIALLNYADGEKKYIVAPEGLKIGQKIISGETAPPEIGNALLLAHMPLGTTVHCIELAPGKGAAIARSAGAYANLSAKEGKFAILKMPSGEVRMVLLTCIATVGAVSNADHNLIRLGKAGANRWRGRRPRNRGVAMNPVDHPMGGGEGRASGGHPRSRTSVYAKGFKTRKHKKQSNKMIISRRPK